MSRSSVEILSLSRTEIARGRPRAALKELELARAALLANADIDGLRELLGLAQGIRTLAPVDTKARERLLAAAEEGIESLAPVTVLELGGSTSDSAASADPRASFSPYARVSTEQILAPARAEIERQNTGRSLRLLEKARRKLLARADIDGFGELIELAQRLPIVKSSHAALQKRLVDAAQQNIRYLDRGKAIRAGATWSDPFASGKPKNRLPSLPSMTRRDKLIAVAIAVALVGCVAALTMANRTSQRVVDTNTRPIGEQGGPTWSPDGKEIAFAKTRARITQITIVSAEGGRLRTVTNDYGMLPD